jgi:hypothetical protein
MLKWNQGALGATVVTTTTLQPPKLLDFNKVWRYGSRSMING